MQPFNFKVVAEDESEGIAIAVAGQTIVDIQNLLTDIGRDMIRTDLRLQNGIPDSILDKFILKTGGQSSGGIGTRPADHADVLIDDAMAKLCKTLSFFGQGGTGAWMDTEFTDPFERGNVARDLIALNDHLAGHVLKYGKDGQGEMEEFRKLKRDKLQEYVKKGNNFRGFAIGSLFQDPKKNRWLFRNSMTAVPVTLSKAVPTDTARRLSGDKVVLVRGSIRRNSDDMITGIDGIDWIEELSIVKFLRMISSDRDIPLLNAVAAVPYHDASRNTWTLRYDPLGIRVTKDSWDSCVMAFHDYFVFLWKTYVEAKSEFSGEEKDIRDLLLSMPSALPNIE
ncbi:MAG: hypothetical protein IKH98_02910 [Candidatus Methanomethylophilaceae archaeon]|nr:hypothetical protein [Candidatus Methanomethylophilaceae archaeon]